MAAQTAADFVPDSHDLDTLSGAAEGCKGCDLYLNANQTVFGAGAQNADMMLVGEQPGDQEDKAGAPFVGPAGKLLDKALVAAGIGPGPVVRHQRGEALQVHASRAR
jgi:DNA polymerase